MKRGSWWKRELYCANYQIIIPAVIFHFVFGVFSALCGGSASLYHYLVLPHFAPPSFVFVIIWSMIYLLLGCALGVYLSTYRYGRLRRCFSTWCLYGLFLVLLFLWYPIFFGAKLFAFALVVIACLISVTLFVIRHYMKRSRLAAFLLIPSIVFYLFCFFLNFCILLLN